MHITGGNLLAMRRSIPVIAGNYLHADGVGAVPVMAFEKKSHL